MSPQRLWKDAESILQSPQPPQLQQPQRSFTHPGPSPLYSSYAYPPTPHIAPLPGPPPPWSSTTTLPLPAIAQEPTRARHTTDSSDIPALFLITTLIFFGSQLIIVLPAVLKPIKDKELSTCGWDSKSAATNNTLCAMGGWFLVSWTILVPLVVVFVGMLALKRQGKRRRSRVCEGREGSGSRKISLWGLIEWIVSGVKICLIVLRNYWWGRSNARKAFYDSEMRRASERAAGRSEMEGVRDGKKDEWGLGTWVLFAVMVWTITSWIWVPCIAQIGLHIGAMGKWVGFVTGNNGVVH